HKIKTLTRWMSNFQGSLQYGGFLFVVATFCRYRRWDLASRNRSFTPSLNSEKALSESQMPLL
ncbi:hypothetical protein, partial [Vibrio cholerae]|uniref:hypothetical protein n=1 Tax=Vibrio cholerae TaxID=666 RepID=UPI001CA31E62